MIRMLSELVPELVPERTPGRIAGLVSELASTVDIPVSGLCDDSRRISAGDLYLATSGAVHDARDHVDDVMHTAAAAICEAPFVSHHARVFELADLPAQKGRIASRFWGEPSKQIMVVGITGTNGKTSCSHFIAQALSLVGKRCGVVGTLGFGFLDEPLRDSGLTTPGALELQRMLSSLVDEGAQAVTIEASSHGLVQGRLNGTSIDLAVFTNISRDHLDYHRTFDDYSSAKRRLFQWPELQGAIVNLDDDFGRQLVADLPASVQSVSYAIANSAASIFCRTVSYSNQGFEAAIVTPWGIGSLRSPLLGEFNVSNLLTVVAALGIAGYGLPEILSAAASLKNVRGRMDAISQPGMPQVVIDYAHTPDALEKALKALRVNCEGKLWCVFGCGGDRDKGKRPQMGRIASECADLMIITDDNPRTEDSAEIIADIKRGAGSGVAVMVESNRSKAIALALQSAAANDMVLIAGKGHEEYQEINGQRLAFSDYSEVAKCLSTLRLRQGLLGAAESVIKQSEK